MTMLRLKRAPSLGIRSLRLRRALDGVDAAHELVAKVRHVVDETCTEVVHADDVLDVGLDAVILDEDLRRVDAVLAECREQAARESE